MTRRHAEVESGSVLAEVCRRDAYSGSGLIDRDVTARASQPGRAGGLVGLVR